MCLISWERTQKGTHMNFFGGIFGSKRGPKRAIFGPRKFSLLFFPALYLLQDNFKNHVCSATTGDVIIAYSQLWQNYLINHFQAKVCKELREQFPEPKNKLDVCNFAFANTANTLQARNYLKYFQGGSKSVIHYLINC